MSYDDTYGKPQDAKLMGADSQDEPGFWVWKCCFCCSCCANSSPDAPPQDFMKAYLTFPLIFFMISGCFQGLSLISSLTSANWGLFGVGAVQLAITGLVIWYMMKGKKGIDEGSDEKTVASAGLFAYIMHILSLISCIFYMVIGVLVAVVGAAIISFLVKISGGGGSASSASSAAFYLPTQGPAPEPTSSGGVESMLIAMGAIFGVIIIVSILPYFLIFLSQVVIYKKYKLGISRVCGGPNVDTMAQY